MTAPPVFPGQTFSGATAVQDYNAYAVAHGYVDPTGNGLGPYLLISTTPASQALGGSASILNTTTLGTTCLQRQDRRNDQQHLVRRAVGRVQHGGGDGRWYRRAQQQHVYGEDLGEK